MDERAIQIVYAYIQEHLDKSDPFAEYEVFTVKYTLKNVAKVRS